MPERRSGHSSRHQHEVELPDHPELNSVKIAAQAVEITKLVADNKRLVSSHAILRDELTAVRHEAIRLKAHTRTVQSETDVQLRVLADKTARAEAIIRAGESARNELAKAIRDAQGIVVDRHELTAKIQEVNKKLQMARDDIKSLPGLRSELDSLRKEHQRHRSTFEYEKGSNMEQVEELEEMEQKLILMVEEVEKVRRAIACQHSMAYLKPDFPAKHGKIVTRPLVPAENVWASVGERTAQSNEDEAAVGPASGEASVSASASGAGKCEESDTPE